MIERQRKTLPGIGPIKLPDVPLDLSSAPVSEGISCKPLGRVGPVQLDIDIGELDRRLAVEDMKSKLGSAVVIKSADGFDLQDFIKKIEVVGVISTDGDGQKYQMIEDNYGSQYRIYIDPKKKVAAPGLDEKNRVLLQVGEEIHYLFQVSFSR
jgi:hypothetical protein